MHEHVFGFAEYRFAHRFELEANRLNSLPTIEAFTHCGQRQLREIQARPRPEIADCSISTIVSLEIGRLRLSPKLGWRISQACGVDYGWLMANDKSLPMINLGGQPYQVPEDFEQAQNKDLESLKFYHVESEMEIGVAYDFLEQITVKVLRKWPRPRCVLCVNALGLRKLVPLECRNTWQRRRVEKLEPNV